MSTETFSLEFFYWNLDYWNLDLSTLVYINIIWEDTYSYTFYNIDNGFKGNLSAVSCYLSHRLHKILTGYFIAVNCDLL